MDNNEVHPLKATRLRRNLSQSMLAGFTELGISTVKRAERGEKISLHARQVLCDYFQASAAELGLDTEKDDDMKRRTLLQLGATSAAALVVAPWDHLMKAMQRSTYVDTEMIERLHTITMQYWHLRSSCAPTALIPGVRGHLESIIQLLNGSLLTETRNTLVTIAGKTAMILGEMSLEAHAPADTLGYFQAAKVAGEESQNMSLLAIALGRLAYLQNYHKHSREGLFFLQRTHALTIHPSDRIWLALVEAETHALLHDTDNCARALDTAKAVASRDGIAGDPYLVDVSLASIPAFEGACYLHLRQPDRALPALLQSCDTFDATILPRRAVIVADIALAYAMQGAVEESCTYAQASAHLTTQVPSSVATERISRVRQELAPWQHTAAVRLFDEQMQSVRSLS